ncbi:MAG: chaperone, ATP12 [Acetobacteraceae bacterium]|nr:chaperone, ATP12 [Acetobacteraceae bacterium]
MKRFWDTATAAPAGDAWHVLLDGKPMRLPGGAPLLLATPALANAIAAEWQRAGGARGGEMSFADTPLTRIAGTAQERVAPQAQAVALEIARYAESDLLCYRADEPDALVQRQAEQWQPWLDWAETRYGARLLVTTGVMHRPQPAESLARLAAAVAALPIPALAALGIVVPATGSLVLGLALAEGALDAATATRAAQLDELFQSEIWGVEWESAERRARVAAEIALMARYLALA